MKEEKTIKAFKGFNSDLTCRGFQYEVGKEYTHEGKVNACVKGFHACANPFDVLKYYEDFTVMRYCTVEQSGEINKEQDKIASSKIKIKAEIGWAGLFNAGIEYLKKNIEPSKMKDGDFNDNGDSAKIGLSDNSAKIGLSDNYAQIGSSGSCAQIGSSGNYAQIGSSGNCAKIGSSGNYAQIGSSGNYAKIGSSGYSAQIGSSGYSAQIGASGNCAKIGSSGDSAQIGSSGYSAQIGASGNCAKIGSSGDYAQIGASGDYAKIGASGNCAKIGSSGYYAQIGSSGNDALIGSSGHNAQIKSEGKNAVVMCAGNDSMACGKIGSWLTLAEWKDQDGEWGPVCVKTERIDGERIKADTFYKLTNGEFTEVENEQ